jgi:putative hydrolase of the HAD superfamily
MAIRAVIFDLDDTLLDRSATIERFLPLQWRRRATTPVGFEAFRARFAELDRRGYAPREEVYAALAEEFRWSLPFAELVAEFDEGAWRECILFPDAESTLQDLRNLGLRIGIVTNGSMHAQSRKLHHSGMADMIDTVLIAESEGVKKPQCEIFERAATRLGAKLTECVFVGDHPMLDIAGARAAGMHAIWMPCRESWPEGVEPPRAVARSFVELQRILARDFGVAPMRLSVPR